MRKRDKTMIGTLLAAVLILCMIPPGMVQVAEAESGKAQTAADKLESSLLGSLCIQYESHGNPESVGRSAGDSGGASYGLYMFSSASGVPQAFFKWLQASNNSVYQSFGNTLSNAYYTGSPGCGTLFDSAWKQCASQNREAFAQAQHDYARERFYLPLLNALKTKLPAFDAANYSIALRSVLMSRAIQHGATGAAGLIVDAFKNVLGGFANQPESELIRAIYEYNARLDSSGNYTRMSGTTAEKYGVSGKTLFCFRGCSGDVQLGVYIRLSVNEPADAQTMLMQYGYGDAPLGEGLYSIAAGENMRIGSDLKLSDGRNQFRLTYYASGFYTLASEGGATRLTGKADGSVAMAAPAADNGQFWELCRYNSGFALKNRATGRYLTATALSAGGKLTTGESMAQWQFTPGNAGWTLNGAVYPNGVNRLKEGSSAFSFKGVLRSTNAITYVRAAILNASGTVICETSAKPNATGYDLHNMDSQMTFSKLSAGNYTLLVTADDASGDHFELRSKFRVFSKSSQESAMGSVAVSGVAIASQPAKTVYKCGEPLELAGLKLTASYSDGGTKTVTDGYAVSGFSSDTPGKKTVTVTYQGKTTSFSLTVQTPLLTGIAVAKQPDKTVYERGELLDTAGLQLTASYSDGGTKTVTDGYAVSGFSSDTPGEKTVTVTYQGKTAAFSVTVQVPVLTGIAVEKRPDQVHYECGEALDTTGLRLVTVYSDGSTEPIGGGYAVSGYDSDTWGDKVVRVTYGEWVATFTVRVGTFGDPNGDGETTDADAVYLLLHTFFPEDYPVNDDYDYDGDGQITDADALYLLMYTFFPESYPII